MVIALIVLAGLAQGMPSDVDTSGPGASEAPGLHGRWTWTHPDYELENANVAPHLTRTNPDATLTLGPYYAGQLDWRVELPDARVGCRLNVPTYGVKNNGVILAETELTGVCGLNYNGGVWRPYWRADDVDLIFISGSAISGNGLF